MELKHTHKNQHSNNCKLAAHGRICKTYQYQSPGGRRQPREKFSGLGRQSLSDAELIAIILGSGNRNETAVQLAQRILSGNGNNINELAKLSLNDLRKYKGIGEVKAINIAAAFELGRRRKESETIEKVKITSSNNSL